MLAVIGCLIKSLTVLRPMPVLVSWPEWTATCALPVSQETHVSKHPASGPLVLVRLLLLSAVITWGEEPHPDWAYHSPLVLNS